MLFLLEGDQTKKLDDLKQTSKAVMEVMTKWTDLLQNEFKCVICHEILVEVKYSLYLISYI